MLDLEQLKKRMNGENLAVMARKLNVTRSYLSALKNGTRLNPSYDMVKRLSDYFGDK